MQRIHAACAASLAAFALAAAPLRAQEWSPPSRQMPEMPATADLAGVAWQSPLGPWFSGLPVNLAEMRAHGEGGSAKPRFIRFTASVRPVQTWTDRNGDGRADLIEVFKDGVRTAQLVDADYDGRANTLRIFDASGNPAREERF